MNNNTPPTLPSMIARYGLDKIRSIAKRVEGERSSPTDPVRLYALGEHLIAGTGQFAGDSTYHHTGDSVFFHQLEADPRHSDLVTEVHSFYVALLNEYGVVLPPSHELTVPLYHE